MMLNKNNQQSVLPPAEILAEVVAESVEMQQLLRQLNQFSRSDAPLLIQGETGTGKDLLAKLCHQWSKRHAEKFIAVNCAGLPPEAAEQEMFGDSTHGNSSCGFFEYANNGTVLLDSINELSLSLQAKLLRFLNDGSYRRVGEEQEHSADVRVICTSQKPLAYYVEKGELREDLYHRLNVLSLNIPPLRQHKQDIPHLVAFFLPKICQQLQIAVPNYDNRYLDSLTAYHWPGNIRELYNLLYRSVISMEADQQLPLPDFSGKVNSAEWVLSEYEGLSLEQIINQFESGILKQFYNVYPSTRKLANRLGISHTTIANKLKQYGIGK
ncbi:transcriptional regulator [Pasteurellaceae bacterium USgator11]|nr:transcriptional regulator [Pasteurellaceae bacterium UScroc12]TNG97460.1 transcriptional regulator [Pasteurellaceae bacterium UScroc31]TNG98363.1 transcriptional regulator [Pasteurellaceae bacterium USgator41]TNH02771.1 transcriptional regulator [Pasteurellaceae bacterium USgator11]